MSTLVTIQSTDLITNSRADINGNFSALNADKIETSVIDTDSTFSANSDAKLPSQKAVKAYVDAGGNVNASTTAKGIVELATSAEIDAGTATGGTGATLVVTADALKGSLAPIAHVYTASTTWTKPSGIKYVVVEAQGAGGQGPQNYGDVGGGGGGGAYSKKTIGASSLGSTETVTVGTASIGSGNTAFGTHAVAGNGANATTKTGASGGIASGGDLNINGQNGSDGHNYISGGGGGSVLGQGGAQAWSQSTASGYNGHNAGGYGGGGGGGASAIDGNPTANGGSGTQGVVIVTEYYV